MKHDIIKTDDYLLVVDEGEIKGWYYDAYINKVKHSGGAEYGKNSITKNIIAHLPLGAPILEGVDLLPPIQDQDDVWKHGLEDELKKLPYTKHLDDGQYNDGQLAGFEWGAGWGYNKAKEKYNYTEEDVKNAIIRAYYLMGDKIDVGYFDEVIQSLSQPKMPIEFECAMKSIPCPDNKPDCIVCHMGIMTTITPEGHTQWVGTYIYE